MRPDDRKYLKSHEWCKRDGKTALVGISDYAVEHLSDLVFLDLPEVGTKVTAGDSFGEIESVKAVSDLYSPVSGVVVDVNRELPDDLDVLKSDPWKRGWMIKVEVTSETSSLLDAAAYEKHLASEG